MTTLVFDIETNGFLPDTDTLWLIIIGDPETGEVTAYSNHDDSLEGLDVGARRLQDADRLVGHNILGFDIPALEKFGTTLDWRKCVDTLVLSRLENPSKDGGHSLDAWGKILGFPKGDFKDFLSYSDEMLRYALQDVRLNLRVWEKLRYLTEFCPRAVEVEHTFAWCMMHQMQNGFCFDRPAAEKLHVELLQERLDIERRMESIFPPRWITKGLAVPKRTVNYKDPSRPSTVAEAPYTKIELELFNPGSRTQVADRLIKKYGWKPRKWTPAGSPQVDEAVLKDLRYPEAQALVEYFTLTKKIGQVDGWLKAERGGRVYGYINTIGANTHRCTHRNPNVAQVDKDKRMRSLFKASPSLVLVGADAEGLELRMLGHYLARWDKGAFSKAVVEGKKEDGTDAHTLNQKAVGLYLRDSAKTFIYALIYGAGDAKLGMIIREDAQKAGKPVPSGYTSAIGKAARARIETNIVGLGELVKAVKQKTKQKTKLGWLIGLDGRKVQIRSEHSALNTLLQSAGAIVMKWAMLCWWEDQGHEVVGDTVHLCANVHDEQQFEAAPEVADAVGKAFCDAITKSGEILGVRCPLSGSYDIGHTWAETH